MMDLSIVIPVYNRAAVVTRTLDSVAAQSFRPLQLVLVDNNSSDGSIHVLESWAEAHRAPDFDVKVISEVAPGASSARNAGLSVVTSRWCMFFDSDDIMLPRHVERAMDIAYRNPDAEIVAWNCNLRHLDGSMSMLRFITSDIVYNNLMHSSFSTQNYMARTGLFRKVGGWNPATRMFDDCELGMRLLMQSPVIVHDSTEITVEVIESEQSITNDAAARQVDSMAPAMEAMRQTLPPSQSHWVDLLQLTMTATWARTDQAAPSLAAELMRRQPLMRRFLFKALYRYALAGGRGVARLYRLITSGRFYI